MANKHELTNEQKLNILNITKSVLVEAKKNDGECSKYDSYFNMSYHFSIDCTGLCDLVDYASRQIMYNNNYEIDDIPELYRRQHNILRNNNGISCEYNPLVHGFWYDLDMEGLNHRIKDVQKAIDEIKSKI